MIFVRVDFPAPFSPTSPCTSPAATSRLTPASACTPGKPLEMPVKLSMAGPPGRPAERAAALRRLCVLPSARIVYRVGGRVVIGSHAAGDEHVGWAVLDNHILDGEIRPDRRR